VEEGERPAGITPVFVSIAGTEWRPCWYRLGGLNPYSIFVNHKHTVFFFLSNSFVNVCSMTGVEEASISSKVTKLESVVGGGLVVSRVSDCVLGVMSMVPSNVVVGVYVLACICCQEASWGKSSSDHHLVGVLTGKAHRGSKYVERGRWYDVFEEPLGSRKQRSTG
jgi:hypothetical protein